VRRLPRCPDSGRKGSHCCDSATLDETLWSLKTPAGFGPIGCECSQGRCAQKGCDCVGSRSFSQVKLCEIPWKYAMFRGVSVRAWRSSGCYPGACSTSTLSKQYGGESDLATGNKKRKGTKLWLAHPPISARVRGCCGLMNDGCGKAHAECTEKWPDATGMVRPPTNTFVTLPSCKDACT